MARRKKDFDKPQKIRTSLEELEVLVRLRETIEWAILKRLMRRYINNLMRMSFNLTYRDSGEDFKVKHRDLTAEARAFKNLVRMVEKAGKRMEAMEKKNG